MIETYIQDVYLMLCKKYPNQQIYVIGDHHFFHKNIINYTRGNFSSVDEMNQYIVNVHNKVVKDGDIVILLGDFCFKNSFIKTALSQMNGYKYLILGNHDSNDLIKRGYDLGFDGVFKNPVKIQNNYLSHEPLVKGEKSDLHFQLILKEFEKCSTAVNYHGHIHTTDGSFSNKYVNATCEVLQYKPVKIGQTMELCEKENSPLFINSSYFDDVVTFLSNKYNVNQSLLLCDYIYSAMLESCDMYRGKYFVQGSFGQLKKYNLLTNISDLDVSFIYNPLISKKKNEMLFKEAVDEVYRSLKSIDGINLSFMKRYSSLCIFEALYVSRNSGFAHCNLDANLIFFDCYKDNDFLKLEGESLIQKFAQKSSLNFADEYQFPHFQAQVLTLEGDIANLLLQIIFQYEHVDKKELALKKLKHICKFIKKNEYMENLENIFTRFFLRNIAFLYTMRRFDEIEYIQKQIDNISSLLPLNLQSQIYDILNKRDSIFLDVYDEIAYTPTSEIFQKSLKIMKELR